MRKVKMKTEILRLLKETHDYVSGQQICDKFGVSRTAVWKAVEQLKKEGYAIEAVRNKGYRLVESPDVMSKAEIQSMMKTKWAGKHVIYYDETDSTNIQAKLAGENGSAHGTLVVADRQVAGKGRRGRSWESPKGVCVYMTLLLRPELAPVRAPMLTLVMALSAAEAIREKTGLPAGIKWPNDIVLNKKKICGILTEMSTEIDYINYVVEFHKNTYVETLPEGVRAETAVSNVLGRIDELGQKMAAIEAVWPHVMWDTGGWNPFTETAPASVINDEAK